MQNLVVSCAFTCYEYKCKSSHSVVHICSTSGFVTGVKSEDVFNVAVCELAGHLPIKGTAIYLHRTITNWKSSGLFRIRAWIFHTTCLEKAL